MGLNYRKLKANGPSVVLERKQNIVIEQDDNQMIKRKHTFIREKFPLPKASKVSVSNTTTNMPNYPKRYGSKAPSPSKEKASKEKSKEKSSRQQRQKLAHEIDTEIQKLKLHQQSLLKKSSKQSKNSLEGEILIDKSRKSRSRFGNKPQSHNASIQSDLTWDQNFTSNNSAIPSAKTTNIEFTIEKYSSQHKFVCASPRYACDETTYCRPKMRTIGLQKTCSQHSLGEGDKCQVRLTGGTIPPAQLKAKPSLLLRHSDLNLKGKFSKDQPGFCCFDYANGNSSNTMHIYHSQNYSLNPHSSNCHRVCQRYNASNTVNGIFCNQNSYRESGVTPSAEYNYCCDEYTYDYSNSGNHSLACNHHNHIHTHHQHNHNHGHPHHYHRNPSHSPLPCCQHRATSCVCGHRSDCPSHDTPQHSSPGRPTFGRICTDLNTQDFCHLFCNDYATRRSHSLSPVSPRSSVQEKIIKKYTVSVTENDVSEDNKDDGPHRSRAHKSKTRGKSSSPEKKEEAKKHENLKKKYDSSGSGEVSASSGTKSKIKHKNKERDSLSKSTPRKRSNEKSADIDEEGFRSKSKQRERKKKSPDSPDRSIASVRKGDYSEDVLETIDQMKVSPYKYNKHSDKENRDRQNEKTSSRKDKPELREKGKEKKYEEYINKYKHDKPENDGSLSKELNDYSTTKELTPRAPHQTKKIYKKQHSSDEEQELGSKEKPDKPIVISKTYSKLQDESGTTIKTETFAHIPERQSDFGEQIPVVSSGGYVAPGPKRRSSKSPSSPSPHRQSREEYDPYSSSPPHQPYNPSSARQSREEYYPYSTSPPRQPSPEFIPYSPSPLYASSSPRPSKDEYISVPQQKESASVREKRTSSETPHKRYVKTSAGSKEQKIPEHETLGYDSQIVPKSEDSQKTIQNQYGERGNAESPNYYQSKGSVEQTSSYGRELQHESSPKLENFNYFQGNKEQEDSGYLQKHPDQQDSKIGESGTRGNIDNLSSSQRYNDVKSERDSLGRDIPPLKLRGAVGNDSNYSQRNNDDRAVKRPSYEAPENLKGEAGINAAYYEESGNAKDSNYSQRSAPGTGNVKDSNYSQRINASNSNQVKRPSFEAPGNFRDLNNSQRSNGEGGINAPYEASRNAKDSNYSQRSAPGTGNVKDSNYSQRSNKQVSETKGKESNYSQGSNAEQGINKGASNERGKMLGPAENLKDSNYSQRSNDEKGIRGGPANIAVPDLNLEGYTKGASNYSQGRGNNQNGFVGSPHRLIEPSTQISQVVASPKPYGDVSPSTPGFTDIPTSPLPSSLRTCSQRSWQFTAQGYLEERICIPMRYPDSDTTEFNEIPTSRSPTPSQLGNNQDEKRNRYEKEEDEGRRIGPRNDAVANSEQAVSSRNGSTAPGAPMGDFDYDPNLKPVRSDRNESNSNQLPMLRQDNSDVYREDRKPFRERQTPRQNDDANPRDYPDDRVHQEQNESQAYRAGNNNVRDDFKEVTNNQRQADSGAVYSPARNDNRQMNYEPLPAAQRQASSESYRSGNAARSEIHSRDNHSQNQMQNIQDDSSYPGRSDINQSRDQLNREVSKVQAQRQEDSYRQERPETSPVVFDATNRAAELTISSYQAPNDNRYNEVQVQSLEDQPDQTEAHYRLQLDLHLTGSNPNSPRWTNEQRMELNNARLHSKEARYAPYERRPNQLDEENQMNQQTRRCPNANHKSLSFPNDAEDDESYECVCEPACDCHLEECSCNDTCDTITDDGCCCRRKIRFAAQHDEEQDSCVSDSICDCNLPQCPCNNKCCCHESGRSSCCCRSRLNQHVLDVPEYSGCPCMWDAYMKLVALYCSGSDRDSDNSSRRVLH